LQTEVVLKTTTGYSGLQIGLHWLVAILIVVAWLSHDGAEEAMETIEKGGTVGFVPHVAFGMAVLVLVVLRLVVRLTRGAPAAPGEPGSLAVRAADWGHRILYVLMIAVPLGGVSIWFLGMDNGDVHGFFGTALLLIALGHAAMALYHQYVLKDGLLRRMMKAG
jgi:cytochrome b561